MPESQIPRIITRLYALVDELQELYPHRKFTLDGHLVGSIGEVVAEHFYNLNLTPHSETHDAETLDETKRTVQIKLTAGKSVSLSVHESDPDILIVLHIHRRSGFKEIFNGNFPCELLSAKNPSKRWVKTVSLNQLKDAQGDRSLNDEGRILRLNALFQKELE